MHCNIPLLPPLIMNLVSGHCHYTILYIEQHRHGEKMQRWALGLKCPSFKTIDKINTVKYVSSLFWLRPLSQSIPSSLVLQLSTIIAALPPSICILNHFIFAWNSTSTNRMVPLSHLKWLNKELHCLHTLQPIQMVSFYWTTVLHHCAFGISVSVSLIKLLATKIVELQHQKGTVIRLGQVEICGGEPRSPFPAC